MDRRTHFANLPGLPGVDVHEHAREEEKEHGLHFLCLCHIKSQDRSYRTEQIDQSLSMRREGYPIGPAGQRSARLIPNHGLRRLILTVELPPSNDRVACGKLPEQNSTACIHNKMARTWVGPRGSGPVRRSLQSPGTQNGDSPRGNGVVERLPLPPSLPPPPLSMTTRMSTSKKSMMTMTTPTHHI